MWESYPSSLRNVGGSTQVPVRALKDAQKGTWGLPPPLKLERRHMTYNVSVWRKTQLNMNLKFTDRKMETYEAISTTSTCYEQSLNTSKFLLSNRCLLKT
jgi:hypothetical protein